MQHPSIPWYRVDPAVYVPLYLPIHHPTTVSRNRHANQNSLCFTPSPCCLVTLCLPLSLLPQIDLDTIETSNLNRQFLFRKSHVGSSKAVTAAQVISTFKPDVRITPHYANVKDPQFDVDFFKGFDLILNGLDNLDARRHVNRLCLAAGTPLVESGTSGYVGQVNGEFGLGLYNIPCKLTPFTEGWDIDSTCASEQVCSIGCEGTGNRARLAFKQAQATKGFGSNRGFPGHWNA